MLFSSDTASTFGERVFGKHLCHKAEAPPEADYDPDGIRKELYRMFGVN